MSVLIDTALSHPLPEEDVRVQLHLPPGTGTSSIGFELTWSQLLFQCGYNFWVLPGTGSSRSSLLTCGVGLDPQYSLFLVRRPLHVRS